ncbi:restriction modification system DNA specificity domain protein [Paracidovorax avenae ATCC 19860]|uniref:Restriction modification system DNA specificity domain protein n=1 Tax=Paracidovorax avenae (strain ATCC 19860 / DSM 7227 / CCUG 15838 / JCM 20985 / LMG 2117 / NCPPB 1011) TaxID=643561 RepID=F0QBT9_PARA1|nr:restriction endonuclease subunit S [Paracidovorax avenae]ADX48555.1 restriction modification system DNA specificity domain protein [Paracidovorax avenae ATCC 19860]
MSSEWRTYRLQEVGRLVTGKTPKSGVPAFDGDDVPFVSPPDFTGSKWITKTVRSISEAGAQSVKGSLIPPRSVLVTCIGSDMGKAAIAASQCVTNQQINAILVDESRFCPEFVYYNLSLRKDEIRSLAGGSAQPILNKSAFGQIFLEAPCLEVQRTVSAALRPLDDRITLLRETNATLEAIAQALFKSWFVDFDPVRAKMAGRAPEGMDEATAALFPDALEETELGIVPKGWQVGVLDSIAALNPESWSTKHHPDRILYVDLANTKANQIEGITEFRFDDAPSRARRVLREGDVIVGTVRPGNGSFARISVDRAGLTGSTGFAVLRAHHLFDQALVYIAATREESIERLAHLADGGAYPAVRPEVVAGTPVVIAPRKVREAFGGVANHLLAQIGGNQEQSRYLGDIRDTLLPRLISGQLRLPEAHEFATELTAH